jgi:hypothetical protein
MRDKQSGTVEMKVLMIIGLATAVWWLISWAAAIAYLSGLGTILLCARLVDDSDEQFNQFH